MADEAGSWNGLHDRFDVSRIDYSILCSTEHVPRWP
jgi:hypothetical protein